MAIPPSVKITKNGVEYLNNVDRANYTIQELTRAALRDTAKLVMRKTKQGIKKRTGRAAKNTQYWLRKKEADLQVGFKPGGFYAGFQELGTSKQPKIGALHNAVADNINEMRKIQAQYLSAIQDGDSALGLIDESEEISDD